MSVMARRTSDRADKAELLQSLRRMEGQVRGIGQMVEGDRSCLDIVQQINAVSAAAREGALIVREGHLRGCVADAVKENDGDAAIKELIVVLGKVLRQ